MTKRTRFFRGIGMLAILPIFFATIPAGSSALDGWTKHTFKGLECGLIPPAQHNAGAIGKGSCRGVRPGGAVLTRSGEQSGLCTMNFVFKGSDRYTYIGTAGHCYRSGSSFEKRWSGYRGPTAQDSYGAYIGNYAYAVLNDTKDFALIRLRPGQKWSAKMCYFGGPDGMYEKHDPNPMVMKQYGNGFYWGSHYPARTYVAPTMVDAHQFFLLGQGGPGDSGSGIINSTGQATGVLVAGADPRVAGFSTRSWPSGVPWVAVYMVATRLDVQVKRAQAVLRTRLRIQNASLAPMTLT